jgi:hypothetical protein
VATTKLVYIEWVDAVADAGWDSAKPPELHPCRTIGFVVSETKEAICIASTLSLEQSNARMHIPKKWIILRRNFKIEDKFSESKREKPAAVGSGSDTDEV